MSSNRHESESAAEAQGNQAILIWPGIARQIAYDLSGSAEVYRLSEDASSELTVAVGKTNSCYLGAIRIYWPIRMSETFPRSTVWTAPQLLPEDESMDQEHASRFRSQLRNRVLAAMSISVREPEEIAAIKEAEIKGRVAKLEAHAADHEAALPLIDELQKKNESLREQLDEANKRCTSLEYQIRYVNDPSVTSPRISPASNDEVTPPEQGEVRFYKKINEAGDHDKFRIVNDCNHNKWQGSKPADKARKGIIRHEGKLEIDAPLREMHRHRNVAGSVVKRYQRHPRTMRTIASPCLASRHWLFLAETGILARAGAQPYPPSQGGFSPSVCTRKSTNARTRGGTSRRCGVTA